MAKRLRVELLATPDLDQVASLWVDVARSDSGCTVTLLHDYPDLHPWPGWMVKGRNLLLEIASVNGRVLSCVEAR